MPDLSSVGRTKVDVHPDDAGYDPEEGNRIRVYYSEQMPPSPSVSVVKGLRVDPEKEDGLAGWRDRFDGQSQWARPWWNDQKMFKAYRGTLVHFAILSELGQRSAQLHDVDSERAAQLDASGETYFHKVGDDDWGHEEYYAEYCLKKWSKKAPSANTDEIAFSPRDNQYDGEHAWDRAIRGITWAANTFKTCCMDGDIPSSVTIVGPDGKGDDSNIDGRIDPANVLAVEQFVFYSGPDAEDETHLDVSGGYGGQYDLLYEYTTDDGETRTVLADLKTSSGVRHDHKLQSAAYKHAVETSEEGPDHIDECEIIRLHPDKEVVEISRSSDWDRSLDGLTHQFLGLVAEAHDVAYTKTLARAAEERASNNDGCSTIDDVNNPDEAPSSASDPKGSADKDGVVADSGLTEDVRHGQQMELNHLIETPANTDQS